MKIEMEINTPLSIWVPLLRIYKNIEEITLLYGRNLVLYMIVKCIDFVFLLYFPPTHSLK